MSDRHLPRAVTKALELVEPESAQHGQHRVRHRRTIRAFDVEVALEVAIAVASQKERTALVVVNVRVAHWRAVEDQRLFQEIRVALGCVTEPFEEVRDGADVVPVDLRELLDPLLSLAVDARPGETQC